MMWMTYADDLTIMILVLKKGHHMRCFSHLVFHLAATRNLFEQNNVKLSFHWVQQKKTWLEIEFISKRTEFQRASEHSEFTECLKSGMKNRWLQCAALFWKPDRCFIVGDAGCWTFLKILLFKKKRKEKDMKH